MSSRTSSWVLADLRAHVRTFIRERDWEQFHNPKNLSMSIAIEAAELMECFQWQSGNDDSGQKAFLPEAIDELADVLIYCIAMADALGIDDLGTAVLDKLERAGNKYPTDQFQGRFK